jgi:histone H1/5
MTESTSAPISSVPNVTASSPKKAKKTTKGKSTQGSSHPKYSDMIKAALKSLNERSGSSRAAILKFVLANYSLDPVQANQHLKLALKNGVKAKHFKQTKGNGASGSFKLAEGAAKPAKKKSAKPKKTTSSSTASSATKKRARSKSAGSKPAKKVAATPANTNSSAATTTTAAATPAATTSATTAAKPKKVKIAKSTTKTASENKTKNPKHYNPKKNNCS